ncbi:MAG: carbohydrate ABC transporter permease [Eubacteriales bacterium]|nr:carbohydrate ABC transporter permease [Eubacteriales bacterium]
MSASKKKKSRSEWTFQIVGTLIFTIIGLICFYPFYYLIICTISEQKAVDLNQIRLLPKGINFQNYIEIFKIQNLGNAAVISVLRTVCTTAVSLVCTSYMAYLFTKKKMWGHTFWYRFVVITMYFSAGLIPEYLNNRMLGLTNTFWIYVIPSSISVYNMVLVKTNIEAMSPELEESAYLDGAGYLTRFFKIVLPLQVPILATISLFTAVNQWNDFFTTKLYITNTKLYTLQYLLYEMLNKVTAAAEQITNENPYATITPTGIRLTLTAVVVIPIICVYPFVQRFYVKGIMVGAVKG